MLVVFNDGALFLHKEIYLCLIFDMLSWISVCFRIAMLIYI